MKNWRPFTAILLLASACYGVKPCDQGESVFSDPYLVNDTCTTPDGGLVPVPTTTGTSGGAGGSSTTGGSATGGGNSCSAAQVASEFGAPCTGAMSPPAVPAGTCGCGLNLCAYGYNVCTEAYCNLDGGIPCPTGWTCTDYTADGLPWICSGS